MIVIPIIPEEDVLLIFVQSKSHMTTKTICIYYLNIYTCVMKVCDLVLE